MTTVKALNEDIFYTILSKCSSTMDMWHFFLALDYELSRMIQLRAFWSHIRLSSLMYNQDMIFAFARQVAKYCVDLRLDHLNWMAATDLRRLLSKFNSLVRFHSGNVALSKQTLIRDVTHLFPYIKHLTLLVAIDDSTNIDNASCSTMTDDAFRDLSRSLNQIAQLEHIALVLQEKKRCLSNQAAQKYFRFACDYVSNLTDQCAFLSIEENGYDIGRRFDSMLVFEESPLGPIHLSVPSTLRHLIISFRPMLNIALTLDKKDSTTMTKLPIETLVLPCLPSTSSSIDILDLSHLKRLDIGHINIKDRGELDRLGQILLNLRNLTMSLNQYASVRLRVTSKEKENTTSTEHFDSVFNNIFDDITVLDDDEDKSKTSSQQMKEPPKTTSTIVDEYILEFLDLTASVHFPFALPLSWLNNMTNLNLTGVHCHSIDFQHIFNSLQRLQSLSLSPCLLFYIDQNECHCSEKENHSYPRQMHSIKPNLISLNLVSSETGMKQTCPILTEQYYHHSIRYSSIHQHLPDQRSLCLYANLIQLSIRQLMKTLDLHHFSIRCPDYELHPDDLSIRNDNHLESLILDVKLPVTFHAVLTRLFVTNHLEHLRRFVLMTDGDFQLTELLLDKFRLLELIEVISSRSHLKRSTIKYFETVLTPVNYPNLTEFRFWFDRVDAQHLLKHFQKTVRSAFERIRPAFQLDFSLRHSSAISIDRRRCALYDRTHEIQRFFHCVPSSHSDQLSIMYPNFLNFKPLYSEVKL